MNQKEEGDGLFTRADTYYGTFDYPGTLQFPAYHP